MLDMPNVPNWLQWIAVSAVPLGILWAVIRWLWRRVLSDLWAKRTRDAAERRAVILIRQFDAVWHLNENDRRFQAISTMMISDLILGGIIMVIGIMVIAGNFILIPDKPYVALIVVGSIMVFGGFVTMVEAVEMRQTFIKPFTNWDEYFDRTLDRIESLLTKAGLSDEKQAEFIQAIVDVAEEETNQPGEIDE